MADDPVARALHILALFSTGRSWTAEDLAEAMATTPRTVRRDIRRLRELGYAVSARPGPGSVYRLDRPAGVPLLLDADDLPVLVSALRAVGHLIDPVAADRALAKLESVVPASLRPRIAGLDAATEAVGAAVSPVAPGILRTVTDAITESGRLRFGYTDAHGRPSDRTADPVRVVVGGSAWSLIAWDLDRDDWRLFRLDRVQSPSRIPGVFTRRPLPFASVAAWFATDFGRISPATGSRID